MGRRGVAVLEAVVALTILGLVGAGLSAVVRQTAESAVRVREREAMLRAADAVLGTYALLDRRDLDRRLGDRRVGRFIVNAGRPERTLYRVAVSDSLAPARELLVTLLHRPVPTVRTP